MDKIDFLDQYHPIDYSGPNALLLQANLPAPCSYIFFSYPSFTQPHKFGRTPIPIIPTGWFRLFPSQIRYVVFSETLTLPTRRNVSIAVYIAINYSVCLTYRHAGLMQFSPAVLNA